MDFSARRIEMPNNGRYTLCPFYRDEKNKSISCEDTFRRFGSLQKKSEWMDRYCDSEWEKCSYAASLLQMYDKLEKGDKMAKKDHKIQALETELRRQSSMLGRVEKRLMEKVREIEDLRSRYEHLGDEMVKLAVTYEKRFCYLIDISGGKFDEIAYQEWEKDKECHLIGMDRDEEGRPTWWKPEIKEVKDESSSADRETDEGSRNEIHTKQSDSGSALHVSGGQADTEGQGERS